MKKYLIILLLAMNLFANQIGSIEKIKIYEMPLGEATKDINLNDLNNAIPLSTKFNISDNNKILNDNNISIIIKKDGSKIEIYNEILDLAYNFAVSNIKEIDKVQLKKSLSFSKIKEKNIFKKNGNEIIYEITDKSTTLITNEVDFINLTLKELMQYYIINYFSLNSDMKKKIIEKIKIKIKIENKFIDTNILNEKISLDELRELEKLI